MDVIALEDRGPRNVCHFSEGRDRLSAELIALWRGDFDIDPKHQCRLGKGASHVIGVTDVGDGPTFERCQVT